MSFIKFNVDHIMPDKMKTFAERCEDYLRIGIPVVPIQAGTKRCVLDGWTEKATADPLVVARWSKEAPDANIGLVAKAIPGGFCFLEFDVKAGLKDAAAEMGQPVPITRTHKSGKGYGHHLFRHTERSIAIGNRQAHLSVADDTGKKPEWFSFRANDRYIVGAVSLHPNGSYYQVVDGTDPIDFPDWLCTWVELHTKKIAVAAGRPEIEMDDDFDVDDFCEHVAEVFGISFDQDYSNNGVTFYPMDGCPNNGGAAHSNHTGQKSCITLGKLGLGVHCFADQCGEEFGIGALLRLMRDKGAPYEGPIWNWECNEASIDIEDVEINDPELGAPVGTPLTMDEVKEMFAGSPRVETPVAKVEAKVEPPAKSPAMPEPVAEAAGSPPLPPDFPVPKVRIASVAAAGEKPTLGTTMPESYAALLDAACYADGKLHRIGRQALESGKPLGWMLPALTGAYGYQAVVIRDEGGTVCSHPAAYVVLLGHSRSGKGESIRHALHASGEKRMKPKEAPVSDNSILLTIAGTVALPARKEAVVAPYKELATMLEKAQIEGSSLLSTMCDLWDDGEHGGKRTKALSIPPIDGLEQPFSFIGGLACSTASDFSMKFPPGSEDGFWGRCIFGVQEGPWFYDGAPITAPRLALPKTVIVPNALIAEAVDFERSLPDYKAAFSFAQVWIRVAAMWTAADHAASSFVVESTVDIPDDDGGGVTVVPVETRKGPPNSVTVSRGVFEAAKNFMLAQYEVRKVFRPGEAKVDDAMIVAGMVDAVTVCMKESGGHPVKVRDVIRKGNLDRKWGYSRVMFQLTSGNAAGLMFFTDPRAKPPSETWQLKKIFGPRRVWLPELMCAEAKEKAVAPVPKTEPVDEDE